jgi:diguanylate cyclase (GGDEF)-like protein
LFVELDGWQEASQQFGTSTAEQVAREVASRMSVARRKTDIVVRVASDKFVVACADVHSDSDALRIASLILDGAARPVVVQGVEHRLRPTVGIVLTDPAGPEETAGNILENAELAMYWARDEGRASRMFDPSMRDRVVSRYEIEHGLQSAMDNGELALFYQPVVDLHSGQVVGAEALLRWQRPDQGLLLPGEFLEVAGDVGMAEALGRWTLDRALTELVIWRESEHLPEQFRLTLNVSGRELADPTFAQTFEELTRKHGVAPTMISIDLSEDAARVAAASPDAVNQLSRMGVQFNLDDFGARDWNLSWLQQLPITSLKIAPEFVGALDSLSNPHGAVMVRALVALGHELRLSIVAEGVETPAQAAALRVIGCEYAQGYHLGHPGPRDQVWAVPEA